MRAAHSGIAGAAVLLLFASPPANAAPVPTLHPWSIELGLAASLASAAGATRAQALLFGGPFLPAGPGLLSVRAETGFTRVRSLKQLDLQSSISWALGLGSGGPVWAHAGLGAGVQHEWLGSFRTARWPWGVDAGVRVVLAPSLGLGVEYRFRRFAGDPIRDFDQHRIVMGLLWFLRNRSPQ